MTESECPNCQILRVRAETLEQEKADSMASAEYSNQADQTLTGADARVPIESAELCNGCGAPYQFDTSIPSAVWNAVIRAQGLPEYLCVTCIVREFAKQGRSFTALLTSRALGFHGLPIEVRLNSAVATDAEVIQQENNQFRIRIRELEARAEAVHQLVEKLQKNSKEYWSIASEADSKRAFVTAAFCRATAELSDAIVDELVALLPAPPALDPPPEKNENDQSRVDKWGNSQADLPRRKKRR